MSVGDKNTSGERRRLSSVEFSLEPRSFVKQLAERMAVDINETTLRRLSERIKQGASREQIIRNLRNIKGEQYPIDKATAALNLARLNQPKAALVVENIVSFAPTNDKAFVLHAYAQVLGRHPSTVELARHTHQLENKDVSRFDLLELLNGKSIEEGYPIIWDSAKALQQDADLPDASKYRGLIETTGFRTLSHGSPETLTLCRYVDEKWELAPSMVSHAEEVCSDSWIVNDGFILTGPKCHLTSGHWLLQLDIVQPEWASVIVDVVANLALDRLFHLTAYGSLRGNFIFEKLNTHTFLEVRLRVEDTTPGQWINIQSIRLKRMG